MRGCFCTSTGSFCHAFWWRCHLHSHEGTAQTRSVQAWLLLFAQRVVLEAHTHTDFLHDWRRPYRSILVSTSPCFLCRCLGVFSMHLVMYGSCNQGITFPSQFAREILARVASQWIAGLIYVFWRGAKAGVPVSDARVLDLDLTMLGPVVYFQMPMFESLSHVQLKQE